MILKIIKPDEHLGSLYLLLNNTSYFIGISNRGLERTDTAYPQKRLDYDRTNSCHKAKITGIDEV